ncbi:MAG: zinc ribbon domain-containing protein [Chloroflexaceae bacterium]|nr:zinc ribbon domain-containing protein [Chloroflexaceae bacterium]
MSDMPEPASNEISCPACGQPNRVGARFCVACGSPLSETRATPASDASQSSSGITRCSMIIGFLVPHRCEKPALGRCQQCDLPFCDEHLSVTPQGLICTACEQGFDRPVAMAETATTYDDSDIIIFASASHWDDDDDLFSDLS